MLGLRPNRRPDADGPAKIVLFNAFSRVVKHHRKKHNLSRAALAEISGLHQTCMDLLERGERSPNLDIAKAIANALNAPLAKLIS